MRRPSRAVPFPALLAAAFTSLLLSSGDALAQGCAMCGTAAGDASDPLARSLSASVLFMMSMPFLLFFSVAGWLVWRYYRARGEAAVTLVKEKTS